MLKKMISLCSFSSFLTICLTLQTASATPFKFVNSSLPVIGDVFNFAYNCISMEDGSIVYDVIPNTYATKGTMSVTIYCSQIKSKIILPLSLEGNDITTPIATYPVKFSESTPLACQKMTKLNVIKDPNFPAGYTVRLG